MTVRSVGSAAVAGLLFCLPLAATAHVTLLQREAAPGSSYKAVFVVPHGCSGSATVKLAVQIPPGVLLVKPMAKPGWKIEMKRAPYAKPWASARGARLTEGVTEVVWSGGKLPDAFYDEFVLSTFLSSELTPGSMVSFPTIQTCETGEHRWMQPPSDGAHGETSEPAPSFKILAPKGEPKP